MMRLYRATIGWAFIVGDDEDEQDIQNRAWAELSAAIAEGQRNVEVTEVGKTTASYNWRLADIAEAEAINDSIRASL